MAALPKLAGLNILIVEDEFLIGDDLAQAFEGAGAFVLGPVPTVERGLALLRAASRLDGAILDINLMGLYVDPVADLIERRGKPFLFATGYGPELLPSLLRRRPILRKPIAMADLKAMIDSLFPKATAKVPL